MIRASTIIAVPLTALAALFLPGANVSAARPQQPTFSSRVDVVRVDVLVTENGRPLSGLHAEDFEVLDEGVPQQVELVGLERLPLNVVLAFDISASVAGTRLGQLRSASGVLLDELKPDDRAALVTFNHVVRLRSKLTTDLGAVRAALEQVQARGGTALIDGSYLALLSGDPDAARGLVIVFSDGFDTSRSGSRPMRSWTPQGGRGTWCTACRWRRRGSRRRSWAICRPPLEVG